MPGAIERLRLCRIVFQICADSIARVRLCKVVFKFAADSIARVRVCKVVCAFVGLFLKLTQLRVSVLHETILHNTC